MHSPREVELKVSPVLESGRWAKEATRTSRKKCMLSLWQSGPYGIKIQIQRFYLPSVWEERAPKGSMLKKPSGGKKQPPGPRKVCQIGGEYQEEEENSLYTSK